MTLAQKIHPYRVAALRWDIPTVFRLNLVPDDGQVFVFKPGQFVMLRLLNADGTFWKQKAFSITTPPSVQNQIELGIKLAGEFTRRAAQLKSGDRVEVAGPFGRFTMPDGTQEVVLVSGGIGVAPFLSMIRALADAENPVRIILLNSNRHLHDVPYRRELEKLAATHPNLQVVQFLTGEEPPAEWKRGRINEAALVELCQPLAEKHFLLCGPPAFMADLRAIRERRDVPKERIRVEHF